MSGAVRKGRRDEGVGWVGLEGRARRDEGMGVGGAGRKGEKG